MVEAAIWYGPMISSSTPDSPEVGCGAIVRPGVGGDYISAPSYKRRLDVLAYQLGVQARHQGQPPFWSGRNYRKDKRTCWRRGYVDQGRCINCPVCGGAGGEWHWLTKDWQQCSRCDGRRVVRANGMDEGRRTQNSADTTDAL